MQKNNIFQFKKAYSYRITTKRVSPVFFFFKKTFILMCLIGVHEPDWLWHLKHTASKHMSFRFPLQANQFRRRRPCTVAIYWSDLQRITRATFPVCLCASLTQKRDQKAHGRSDEHVLKRLIVFLFLRKTERKGACVCLKHQPAPIRPRWNAVICAGVNGLCH